MKIAASYEPTAINSVARTGIHNFTLLVYAPNMPVSLHINVPLFQITIYICKKNPTNYNIYPAFTI